MGILSRWRQADRMLPRKQGSGLLWSNTIVPSSVGPPETTRTTSISMSAPTNAYTRGPNPEPYLHTGEYKDPTRGRAPAQHLQPEIPVAPPWYTSSVYVNNGAPSVSTPYTGQAPIGEQPNTLRSIAYPITTQRDTLYDDADYHRLQRFYFSHTPSQMYFNQAIPLPEFTTPSVKAHGVITGNNDYYPSLMQHGWTQSFVPEPGMRLDKVGVAPPWLLSRPLRVVTGATDTSRVPIKARAPKRRKAGGA